MTKLAQLLADCDQAGIRLNPEGNDQLTIDAPQSALTPDLLERLRAQKQELLRILRVVHSEEPEEDWPESIDARKVEPCPKCGTLELWQNLVGDWRCQRCDPPNRWRAFAARHGIPTS